MIVELFIRNPHHLLGLVRLFIVSITLTVVPVGCIPKENATVEIVISLKEESMPQLKSLSQPEPMDTGISSLDVLNEKWQVKEMVPVFPDLSEEDLLAEQYGLANIYLLRLPAHMKLEQVIRDYVADPHIEYAEVNAQFEAN